jgi:triphosphoribosyl-dephospho-CoA synthase
VSEIAEAFIASCRDEIEAPKPGNVHIFSEGHGMTAKDFLRSAEAAAGPLCASSAPVGARIFSAIEATWTAVGMNTNLGIVLLCAPLAAAAQNDGDLRLALSEVLAGLTRADAEGAFRAILRAAPAGLGAAQRHDVRGAAEATLLEAMREAADRDRIALQYVSRFSDVFETGMQTLHDARLKRWPAPWPVASVYLAFLANFPDSHIARKHGPAAAASVQIEAREARGSLAENADPGAALPELMAFDRRLKAAGFNPGTSADLTVATLFADRLTRILIKRRNND